MRRFQSTEDGIADLEGHGSKSATQLTPLGAELSKAGSIPTGSGGPPVDGFNRVGRLGQRFGHALDVARDLLNGLDLAHRFPLCPTDPGRIIMCELRSSTSLWSLNSFSACRL